MNQNIYDNDDFFEGYSRLPRSVKGLEGAPEWRSLRAMLPELDGLRVLDLGCGFGWFCRWAAEQGAADVVGIDVSEKMLARAGEMTDTPSITYRQADLEEVELPAASFDLVYSSLAFTTSSPSTDSSRRSTARWCRGRGGSFSRWSTRSTPRRPSRAG